MTNPAPRKRTRASTTDTITTARSGGSTVATEEKTKHRPSKALNVKETGDGLVAMLQVRDGVTLNMLEFNSFRRDIGLELPVSIGMAGDVLDEDGNLLPEVRKKLDATFSAMQGWLSEKTDQVLHDAQDYFGA